MRYHPLSPQRLPLTELAEDFGAARDLGKARLGQRCVYFTRFARTDYLPLAQISRVWLRQEAVNAQLCCGRADFDQFFLMVQDRAGQVHRGQLLNLDLGKQALAGLARLYPDIPQGVERTGGTTPPPTPGAGPSGAG